MHWPKLPFIKKPPRTAGFQRETLAYRGEVGAAQRERLQALCDVLNSTGTLRLIAKKYTVEGFRIQNEYQPRPYRYSNAEGDIWLYYMGCTDGTHAPADFRESEWLMFCYKGFAAELHFEEQREGPVKFMFKYAFTDGCDSVEMPALDTMLQKKGISVEAYHQALREALHAQEGERPNYYGF